MKVYNIYILIIAPMLLLTTIILAALGVNSLDGYYSINIIEALLVTELFVYFNAKARRGLTMVSTILLGGFLVVVSLQVFKMLAKILLI